MTIATSLEVSSVQESSSPSTQMRIEVGEVFSWRANIAYLSRHHRRTTSAAIQILIISLLRGNEAEQRCTAGQLKAPASRAL